MHTIQGQVRNDDKFKVKWHHHTFFTNAPIPSLDANLTLDRYPDTAQGYYFVQFTGPVNDAMKQQVYDAGGELLDYVPENTFITRLGASARQRVEALDVVQWVGIYQPAFRLSESLSDRVRGIVPRPKPKPPFELEVDPLPETGAPAELTLVVIVFKGEDLSRVQREISGTGATVLSAKEGAYRSRVSVRVALDRVDDLARITGVMWIEEREVPKLYNGPARGVINTDPVWNAPNNLTGNGQTVCVADGGIDTGINDATMHDDIEGRITSIFSWPVQAGWGAFNVGADDGADDIDNGHGTHVAGSVLGDGSINATYAGSAPDASLVFQAVQQFSDFWGTADDGFALTGIPLDLNDLFQEAYDAGARIQSNSWGGGIAQDYDDFARAVDEFVRDHPDMLILFAIGNDGFDDNGDNVIDPGSITPPATAKNCLSVGATENDRPAVNQTWAPGYGPFFDVDRRADNTGGMAAFSSRGPAANNRIKPDVVAPGTMIVSTRTQAAPNTVWYNDNMEGGLAGWNAGGNWAQSNADAVSGNTSWHDSPAGNYAPNSNALLTSPAQNLTPSGQGGKAVQFWVRYDFPDDDDTWTFEVSNNGFANFGDIDPVTGTQANWELWSIGIGSSANLNNLQVRFRVTSDGDAIVGDGLWIDDVRFVEGAFGGGLPSDFGLAAAGSPTDQNYLIMKGTSMATPLTAGAAALVRQYYTDTMGLGYVSAALLRATLINGAVDITPGQYSGVVEIPAAPNDVEGWGRVDVTNSLFPTAPATLDWVDELAGLGTGESHDYTLNITDATVPISVTMVYHDAPGAAIVNQLDLSVTPPAGGAGFSPNGLAAADPNNNVERVVIDAGQVQTGNYTITVNAPNVPVGPQPYALVTSAGGTLVHRDPVDVVLVLDLSGSMLSPACPDCDPKIDVLKESVEIFVQLWTALAVPNDRLGVTYFRTNIDEFDVGGDVLLPVVANAPGIITDVQGQSTVSTNLTAMGGGIQTALGRLTDAARPRSVILFTDGMQNVNPMVREIDDSPPPSEFHLEIDDEPGRTNSGVAPTVPPTRLDSNLGRKVNTIGVGASDAFVARLEDIASETNGVTKTTLAPDDDLRRFYVEELVDALREFSPQLLDYRKGQLTGNTATEVFTVNKTATKIVLKLSWDRGGDLQFKVLKDGLDVTKIGKIVRAPFYVIYSLELPADFHGQVIEPQGDWVMQITGSTGAAYDAAAIADEMTLKYSVSVGAGTYSAGEPIEFGVRLSADRKPITDAQVVQATIQRPRSSIGTLLSRAPTPSFAGVAVEPAATGGQKKLQVLLQDPGFWGKIQSTGSVVPLRNNGDGSYTGVFTETTVPGTYRVTFEIAGHSPDLGNYHRSETLCALVEFGAADRMQTEVRVAEPQAAGDPTTLTIRPRDRAGNYLGPDYGHKIDVVSSEGSVGAVVDVLDGRYKVPLTYPAGAEPEVTITVMDRPFYQGPLADIDDVGYRFALSAHGGVTQPLGNFNNNFDADVLFEVDVEYALTRRFSVVGVGGRYDFDPDYKVLGGTAYLRFYHPIESFRVFAEAGPGWYDPDQVQSAFGLSAGAGVDRAVTWRLRAEVGVDYFHVFSDGDEIGFLGIKGGVRLGI